MNCLNSPAVLEIRRISSKLGVPFIPRESSNDMNHSNPIMHRSYPKQACHSFKYKPTDVWKLRLIESQFQVMMSNNMDEHDSMEVNNAQVQSEGYLLVAAGHDQLEINNQQLESEPEQPVAVPLIETYEHLKIEIIDLFRMLKVTCSSNQHLALALQINPSLQLLRQFDQQIEEQINANMQKELEEFQQNVIWNEIAIDEIAIPWIVD
ncbi:hypothetical protein RHGRI_018303 [Rhododendron griersonianum]|uniref:Uncharacterized protein n=1 Tax=Rhododendron griersonianum TaxID=479676 RepID=A0AAV6HM88_9ERIC|nr:hypothetical protein RHGRI_038829 [Rhododendron griersonianum]KAG5512784.1 hypothetical protein RHGRI_038806 [Rhododendron griersonianum]KAG5546079.1 hypothetical protein RHGRI_018303 [Rhododendron griersonianum]